MQKLPLIALRGIVVFPSNTVTVDLGRQKSIDALNKADIDDTNLLLVTQRSISNLDPKIKDLYEVGTLAKIKQVLKLTNENVRVLVEGLERVVLKELVDNGKILEGSYEILTPTNINTIKSEALLRKARELLAELVVNSSKFSKETIAMLAEVYEPNVYVDNIVNSIVYNDKKKQELLEIVDTEARLEEVCNILAGEIQIAKIEKRITNRVQRSIDKGQKEYYLREQMKAISEELGEGEQEVLEMEKKIKTAKMPKATEEKALKEISRFRKMTNAMPDATVIRTYIDTLTELEWNFETADNKDLKKAREVLEQDHFGLEKIKERILEYLAVMQLSGNLKSPILCFVGPPGVGKTSIVKSIARALGRKYVRMSLGGIRDEAEIRGHRRTYIGAIPGRIIYHLKQTKCLNPVFLLDEIDKMASDYRGDPASAMLEVLDPEQNFAFVDNYLEVPFDLSKVLFVATANSADTIPLALLDRMEIIELSGYSEEEKIEIAKRFLLPKQILQNGLKSDSIKITEQSLRNVINLYTRESGVRTLERELSTICRKVALKQVEDNNTQTIVTPTNINDFLGIEKYSTENIFQSDEIGSAVGLAWTAVGGTTLTIDVTLFKGKGEILLTGKLGDVMKESARTAISLVRSRATDYDIDPEIFANTDIHIHIPEGAIPKDGPSAGVTLATAILSAFSNRKVSKKVAMTGEVTLRGRVLPIGGLKEKALAAYRVGIKKIIIPRENEKDLVEIPSEIRSTMDFVLSDDISTVFDNSLCAK